MKTNVKNLVLIGLLAALTLLLGMTPIGIIPLGFINVTIMCLPVIIGTLTNGLPSGIVLGVIFGLASTFSAFGLSLTPPSALASQLYAESPLLLIIMCMVPRILIPISTHFIYKLIAGKENKRRKTGIAAGSVAGSLTNTILYLGFMLLFYTITGIDSTSVLAIIGGTGLIAGSCEAIAAAIVCTPVILALDKIFKKGKNK